MGASCGMTGSCISWSMRLGLENGYCVVVLLSDRIVSFKCCRAERKSPESCWEGGDSCCYHLLSTKGSLVYNVLSVLPVSKFILLFLLWQPHARQLQTPASSPRSLKTATPIPLGDCAISRAMCRTST